MILDLVCLLVHPQRESTKELAEVLHPDMQFALIDHAHSIGDAFQKLLNKNYNLCFIHNRFDKDFDVFMGDMTKVGRDKTCAFVELWDELPAGFDKEPYLDRGFAAVVSKEISQDEKITLQSLLKAEIHRQEVTRRIGDISEALQLLVRELDHAAQERQRGKKVEFNELVRNFVAAHADFDQEVLDEYFEGLSEHTSRAASFKSRKLNVPEAILKKRPPGLSKDVYSGMSRRVWQKMLKKFGVPEEIAREALEKVPQEHSRPSRRHRKPRAGTAD